jgi:hypothetical protein
MIDTIISSGAIAWIALGALLLELMIVLGLARSWATRMSFIANGLSGACLIMAFRAALIGAGTLPIAVWLGLGLAAHLADVAMRLRQSAR